MNPFSQKLLPVLAVTTMALLSGCIVPYHYTDLPAVDGRVTDHANNKSVTNALVTITSSYATRQVGTNMNGSFSLPAVRHLGLLPFPTEGLLPYPADTAIRVAAPGYYPFVRSGIEFPSLAHDKSNHPGSIEFGGSDREESLHVRIGLEHNPTLRTGS